MARKSRRAARGRHNKARLHKLNERLAAAGIAAQSSLTSAEVYRKRLAAIARQEEEKKAAPTVQEVVPVAVDDKKEKFIAKIQKRREQAHAAREAKLKRTIQNQNIQQ